MSLSINLGRLSTVLSLLTPRLPQITLGALPSLLPNVNEQQTSSSNSNLQQRLQDFLENRENASEDPFFIDNGFLRAVPKKKVTHQRKRRRQLAPGSKQLKYLHHLNRCPSCGHYKRAHTLCMHCVLQIKNLWKSDAKKELIEKEGEAYEQVLDKVDKRILYPGKHESEDDVLLKKKDYVLKRTRSLPVDRS